MRAFPMDAQAYVGVGAPIRADYYVVSPHILRVRPFKALRYSYRNISREILLIKVYL